jgi:hypothetical protein
MCEKILKKKRKAYSYEVGFTAKEHVYQISKFQLQYPLTEVLQVIGSKLLIQKKCAVGEEAGQ